jgi:hypothetical protein
MIVTKELTKRFKFGSAACFFEAHFYKQLYRSEVFKVIKYANHFLKP